jgi:hypothetical protein
VTIDLALIAALDQLHGALATVSASDGDAVEWGILPLAWA